MDLSREIDLEARLVRVEKSIALLQRSVDALLAERSHVPGRAESESHGREQRRDPLAEQVLQGGKSDSAEPATGPRGRRTADDIFGEGLSAWFSSKSPEWWLSRFGIGFVILAVLLLYSFAIDKGWITSTVRVAAGTLLGGILFLAGTARAFEIPTMHSLLPGVVSTALLPRAICRTELASGQLVQVLPDWAAPEGIVHLVFTSRRGMLPSVRAVIDFAAETCFCASADFPRRAAMRPSACSQRKFHKSFCFGSVSFNPAS